MSTDTGVGLERRAVLARGSGAERARVEAGCVLLEVAADWAAMNPGDGLMPQDTRLEAATERAMVIAGDGTPTVAEASLAELGLEIGRNAWQSASLVADALDLQYRLTRTWKLVQQHRVQVELARRLAYRTRLLTPEQADQVDAEIVVSIMVVGRYRLETLLDAAIKTADPEGTRRREELAARWRGVRLGRDIENGIVQVLIQVTADAGHAIYAMCDHVAALLMTHRDHLPEGVPDRGAQSKDEWRAVAAEVLMDPFLGCRVVLELDQPELFQALVDSFGPLPPDSRTTTTNDDDLATDSSDDADDSGGGGGGGEDGGGGGEDGADGSGDGADGSGGVEARLDYRDTNSADAWTDDQATDIDEADSDGGDAATGDGYRDGVGGGPEVHDCDTHQSGDADLDDPDSGDHDPAGADSTDHGPGEHGPDRQDCGARGPDPYAGGHRPGDQGPSDHGPDGQLVDPQAAPQSPAAAQDAAIKALIRALDPQRLMPRVRLNIHLSQAALRGEHPVARVEELGPQLVTTVRDWLRTGVRIDLRPIIDPDAIPAVDNYETPAAMRMALFSRSPASVFPFSNSVHGPMDLDHTIPYRPPPIGPPGQTGLHGLGPLIRREHRSRTFGRIALRQPEPGTFLWRTQTGRLIITNPAGTLDLGTGRVARTFWDACKQPTTLETRIHNLVRKQPIPAPDSS